MMTGALYLSLVHVGFLIAVSMRLRHIGVNGSGILKLISLSLSLWPIVFLVGIVFRFPLLEHFGGLTAILVVTLIYYAYLEFRIIVENTDEHAHRVKELADEEERHEKRIQADAVALAQLFPIKSYMGDNASLLAISDLGKLNHHGILCRIEGGIVKTLYVQHDAVDEVGKIIEIASAPCDPESAT